MNMNTKTYAAILGMALLTMMAFGQFRTLMETENGLATTSVALLTMTVMSGLVAVFTSVTTLGLLVKATKN